MDESISSENHGAQVTAHEQTEQQIKMKKLPSIDEPLQIAGSRCAVCGEQIVLAQQGIGCVRCRQTHHRACLQGTVCPKCNQDMEAFERARVVERRARDESRLRSGRLQMQICLVLLAMMIGFTLIAPILLHSRTVFQIGTWLQAIWITGLGYWTYTGKTWARVVLVLYIFMGMLASISMLYKATGHETNTTLIYWAFSLACLVMLGILVCSSNVYHFLASQRE
jgi:hypothetical protein